MTDQQPQPPQPEAPERVWISEVSLEIAQRNSSSRFYLQRVDGLVDVEFIRADLVAALQQAAREDEREQCAKIARERALFHSAVLYECFDDLSRKEFQSKQEAATELHNLILAREEG